MLLDTANKSDASFNLYNIFQISLFKFKIFIRNSKLKKSYLDY